MNHFWSLLAIGFLGLALSGCGGGGDMMAPDTLPEPTPEQLEAEKKYAEEAEKGL